MSASSKRRRSAAASSVTKPENTSQRRPYRRPKNTTPQTTRQRQEKQAELRCAVPSSEASRPPSFRGHGVPASVQPMPTEARRFAQHAREETDLSKLLSEKRRQLHNTALLGCFLVSVGICVLALLLIPFHLNSPEVHSWAEDVCDSGACYRHERFLLQTMNPKANACHAFGTYVCGLWTNDYPAFSDVEALVRKDALQEGANFLRFHPHKSRVAEKASRMLHSCLEQQPGESARDEGLRSFRTFLQICSLSWPDVPLEGKQPLDVLLCLSVNWGIDLWFRVRVRRDGLSRLQIMQVPVTWSMLARTDHVDELQAATEAMLYAKELGAGLLYNRTRALTVHRTEGSVQKFFDAISSTRGHADRLIISHVADLAQWTPTVTSKEWQDFLTRHLSVAVRVRASTEVLIDSANHLIAVGALLKKFVSKELLDVIGWWVARLCTDLTALAVKKDGQTQAMAPLVCQRRVEACYGLALDREIAALQWPPDLRHFVDDIFESIKSQAIISVQRCSWMDVISKRNVVQKLDEIKLIVWPDGIDENAVDDVYNEFPAQASRYIDYWTKAKGAIRSLLGKREGLLLQRHLTAGSDPLVAYDYWDNTLTVSQAALRAPIVSPNMTPAINYAGLGTLFARALVQAFDVKGVALASADDRTPLLVNSTERALAERLACADPAAELSAAAFLHSAWQSSAPPGLEVSGVARPADQVFFLAQCRMMCGDDQRRFCAHEIRHVDAFVRAFGCKKVSPSVKDKEASCLFFA